MEPNLTKFSEVISLEKMKFESWLEETYPCWAVSIDRISALSFRITVDYMVWGELNGISEVFSLEGVYLKDIPRYTKVIFEGLVMSMTKHSYNYLENKIGDCCGTV